MINKCIKIYLISFILLTFQSCSIERKITNKFKKATMEEHKIGNPSSLFYNYINSYRYILDRYFENNQVKNGEFLIISYYNSLQRHLGIDILCNNKIKTFYIDRDNKITEIIDNEGRYSRRKIKIDFIKTHINEGKLYKLKEYHLEKKRQYEDSDNIELLQFIIKDKLITIKNYLSYISFQIFYSDSQDEEVRKFGKELEKLGNGTDGNGTD